MTQDANEYGIWRAHGADRNFDFAGAPSCPFLGYFEGYYKDVLQHVRKKKSWKTYHNEGTLEKVIITKIENSDKK